MKTLMLDKQNNLVVGNDFILLSGIEALTQDIRTRLGLFNGEYPFDTTQGIDYVSLFQNNDKKDIQNAIITEIKKDKRVAQVIIENFNFENSNLTLDIKIISTSGEVAYV